METNRSQTNGYAWSNEPCVRDTHRTERRLCGNCCSVSVLYIGHWDIMR